LGYRKNPQHCHSKIGLRLRLLRVTQVSASCLGSPYHLDEHGTSVLRSSDLVEEIDASILELIICL